MIHIHVYGDLAVELSFVYLHLQLQHRSLRAAPIRTVVVDVFRSRRTEAFPNVEGVELLSLKVKVNSPFNSGATGSDLLLDELERLDGFRGCHVDRVGMGDASGGYGSTMLPYTQ